ncbi:MAG: DASS family sodium-coupled anion symporter [Flavobacteriales bacterium]|nr:DASS family sodium-coupled anion symporter [Flavobacteriales bacterium]
MSDSRTYSRSKIRVRIERQSKAIMFLSSILISFLLVYFLRDPNFTATQDYVMFLLFVSIGLWVTEAIPPFAVGILIVGYLVFTMGNTEDIDVKKYVQTWSSGVIWLFLGGFFLAEGMRKTKLDEKLLQISIPKFGNSAKSILLGLMLITAVLSMLMSNTATTAMIIATITPLIVTQGMNSPFIKALVIGIPAAASIGGMGTIIGSAPNAIAVGALQAAGHPVTFIQWMMLGIPIALVLVFLFYMVLIRKYKLKDQKINIDFLTKSKDEVKDVEEDVTQKRIMLVILVLTLGLWLTSQWTGIPVAAVSAVPIVGLTMFGIVDAEGVRRLSWDTLMLVAGGLALGLAIEEQGIAQYFVDNIKNFQFNYYVLLGVFGLITVTLSNFMSNTAATTILVPIGMSLLTMLPGVNPLVLPLVIGLSASCALLLPVSTPPNAIAYSTGVIEQKEFRLGGIFVGLLGPAIIIIWTLIVSAFL